MCIKQNRVKCLLWLIKVFSKEKKKEMQMHLKWKCSFKIVLFYLVLSKKTFSWSIQVSLGAIFLHFFHDFHYKGFNTRLRKMDRRSIFCPGKSSKQDKNAFFLSNCLQLLLFEKLFICTFQLFRVTEVRKSEFVIFSKKSRPVRTIIETKCIFPFTKRFSLTFLPLGKKQQFSHKL